MNYDCIIYLDLDDDGDEDEEEDEDEGDSDDDVSSTVAIVSYVSVFSALLIAIAYKNRWVVRNFVHLSRAKELQTWHRFKRS